MTKDRVIESWALPRHLGGPRVLFDNEPPLPPHPPTPPTPPAPPAPPIAAVPTPEPLPLPPTPPRAPGQTDTERAQQLEGILADVRAEAAQRRITGREAESRANTLNAEIATIRAEADRREAAALAAGNTRAERIKGRTIDAELRAAASASGLADMDLLPLMDRAGVTCDDDGNVAGVQAAIDAFKVRKPEYFRAGTPTPPAPPPVARRTGDPTPPPPPGPGAPAPQAVAAMPKADYKKAQAAALAGLRGR